ncbi:MAG: hypothetical protein EOO20_11375 [Chryseobacterium sp.]|nr:MAG: hypothetical protein EOO20_11375 [Chryseobacterium sp.]
MAYTEEKKREILEITERLMNEASITIRDTWTGLEGENLDDGFHNNGESGGPRLFDVLFTRQGKNHVGGHIIYPIPGFNSVAYDNYKIKIPERNRDKKHIIIHETVHFLQHMTEKEEAQYISLRSETEIDYKE